MTMIIVYIFSLRKMEERVLRRITFRLPGMITNNTNGRQYMDLTVRYPACIRELQCRQNMLFQ